jgi:hypothetical protein
VSAGEQKQFGGPSLEGLILISGKLIKSRRKNGSVRNLSSEGQKIRKSREYQ